MDSFHILEMVSKITLTVWVLKSSVLSVLTDDVEKNPNNCIFSTFNKPFGYFYYNSGTANISPFYENFTVSREKCNQICQYNDTCYATSYYNNSCKFYNTNKFTINTNGYIQYSKWMTCNTSEGIQPSDNRCRGLWITYSDTFVKVEKFEPLKNISIDFLGCRNVCIRNPLCGFVNRHNDQCILVAKWPHQSINIRNRLNWEMDEWICVDNFINNFQTKKENRKPIVEKCTGYWEIINRNTTLTLNQSRGLSFHTQIYEDCLEECNQYSNCSTAWYNFTYSLCILKDIEISEVHILFNDTTFINFEWKCVYSDSRKPLLNTDERKYLNLGMSCYKIVNDTNLFIGRDKCGQGLQESEFNLCSENHHKLWNIKESCLKEQRYWGFQPLYVSMNITGRLVRNLIKVFTGLQLYWIAFSDNHIKKVNDLECRHFHVSRTPEKLQFKEIISKEEWQSQKPVGYLKPFKITPINIVITASQQPFHSCKTKKACSDIIRKLQVKYFSGLSTTPKFSDIPYNFMIDDSGHIYECRGVKNQCAAIYPYNHNTICIGYIGWYANKLPNEAYLSGIKKLIEYFANNQYVVKNYTVYIHQDLTKVRVNRNLAIVIKNFYRYKGFIPDDCRNTSYHNGYHKYIYSNLLIFIVIIQIMFFLL